MPINWKSGGDDLLRKVVAESMIRHGYVERAALCARFQRKWEAVLRRLRLLGIPYSLKRPTQLYEPKIAPVVVQANKADMWLAEKGVDYRRGKH